ncbi:hypothetical protein B0H17DRAFT_1338209 [Mycena rosella]|uniref:Uncharacterized protein n=1 Tax=Mycena rosella TaxID=1033263 RepID=A0AAD7CR17_MYCRO|nr:hypothetical protein B0H17DRAFT_1338209 [Mycena rosella]
MSVSLGLHRNRREWPQHIPQPHHRHGAPSGPWPFLDLDSEINPEQLANPQRTLKQNPDWSEYPQSLYPNWTPPQQQKSGIRRVVDSREPCTIHHVNVSDDGIFAPDPDEVVNEDNKAEYWKKLEDETPDGVRLRALFLHNLSGPVLQMLGTKYNVEPFFFSSSLNWIPARYQEVTGEGDHITLTLTFIRCMERPETVPSPPTAGHGDQVIDTHTPLSLNYSNLVLFPDILAIHMVRSPTLSTIISYHPPHNHHRTTTAHALRTRLLAAGQSVYWNKIFSTTISSDPTFVLLALLWYPIYAFDEALEALYVDISGLESRVMATTDMSLTQKLHVVRAHLLHYASLLEDFSKTVKFVAKTRNRVVEHASGTQSADTITYVKDLMQRESANLLSEISRLEQTRMMQDSRLKNVIDLAFSSVNLEDSKRMQELTEAAVKDSAAMKKLTEATVRDSAAMKQISYLTMFFLPATFAATVFGMNLKEITPGANGTVPHYLALTLPLTAVTVWIIMAFQYRKKDPNKSLHDDENPLHDDILNHEGDSDSSMWSKLKWPLESIQGFRQAVASKASSRPNSARVSRRNSESTYIPA